MDGHDYMYALSEMLDSAKEVIFILVRYLSLSLLAMIQFQLLLMIAWHNGGKQALVKQNAMYDDGRGSSE